jgi:hypothetical protein
MMGEYVIDIHLTGLIFYAVFNDKDGSSHHIMLMLGLTVKSEIISVLG